MPSPLPRQDRWKPFARTVPSASAFPEIQAGRLLHHPFRGLLSVHSRYGLHARRVAIATLYTGGSGGFVTSTAAPIATGWSEQFPGETFTRCGPTPFHGALNNTEFLNQSGPFEARYLAFLETITHLRPSLHRYCSRMTGSVMDGEDVVQEALFDAYRNLDKLDDSRPLKPWLFQIAHNRCIDFLRRR